MLTNEPLPDKQVQACAQATADQKGWVDVYKNEEPLIIVTPEKQSSLKITVARFDDHGCE